jgi:hypothetical protein
LEVDVSLISKKGGSRSNGRASQVLDAATQQVAPVAQQVVPAAKNAGQAAMQGVQGATEWVRPRVEEARSWVEPRVQEARSWAAPRVEQAGLAVRDKIAPSVSAAIVEASRRLDVQPAKRRRVWPRVVGIVAMVAAAASAAAAVFLKRQANTFAENQLVDDPDMPAPAQPSGATQAPNGSERREGDGAIDGHPPTS